MFGFLKGKKKILWVTVILVAFLIAGGFLVLRNGGEKSEVVKVVKRDLLETVNISGKVEADIVSDLGFDVSGKISQIFVKESQKVFAGARLASLSLGTLPAELRSAEANLALKRAQESNTTVNLEAIKNKQDALVRSAERKLLSSDLEALPKSENTTITAPTLSGLYAGSEGRYEFVVLPGRIAGDYKLHVSGVEFPEPIDVSENRPTSIGVKGLFVDFSEKVIDYSGIKWFVDIPNTRSSNYVSNFNAYNEAERERDRAIEEAQGQLRQSSVGDSITDAEIQSAQAQVEKVQAEIFKRTVFAPFAGTISRLMVNPGEIVSAGEIAMSLISSGVFGVEVELPEIDSVRVSNGNTAEIRLDALEETLFEAEVVSVDRTETIVDGVPVYKARLAFLESDEAINSGMTADVVITTRIIRNALALPSRSVQTDDDGGQFVWVAEGEDSRKVAVVTGLRSTDGFIEIKAGLKEGQEVLVKDK